MASAEVVNNHVDENHKEESPVKAQESVSTLSIASDSVLNQRHPLKHRWTLWFLNDKKELEWLDRLKNVCTMSSAEEFWAVYDNIRPPSVLLGCDYNLFKEGIEPMWEVKENMNGGRLVVTVDKSRHDQLDALWLELLLGLIGEQFGEDSDQICGAVCNIRQKGSKISLWTRDSSQDEANMRLGKRMKEILFHSGRPAAPIKYEDHRDVQSKSSSAARHKFIV
ncbi:IFE-1 protein [Aphelenchoides avenae]|nr:IFE-1 protein [Aphelenchus avenae]